jgi:putative transcriptional regulator
MNVLHHLDDATLLRYASGDLDEAFSVVVASHIALCEKCRQAARFAEDIGGHLLENCDTAELPVGAFDRFMQQIDRSADRSDGVEPATHRDGSADKNDVPAPLRRFVGGSLEAISWKVVAPGVRKHAIALSTSSDSSLYMLNIAPGKVVPEHGHGGEEMTLILSGAYNDELGRFGPGDIADLDEHVEHQPRVEPDGPCICLVATEAPTRFKGLFSRLVQPLVGI